MKEFAAGERKFLCRIVDDVDEHVCDEIIKSDLPVLPLTELGCDKLTAVFWILCQIGSKAFPNSLLADSRNVPGDDLMCSMTAEFLTQFALGSGLVSCAGSRSAEAVSFSTKSSGQAQAGVTL